MEEEHLTQLGSRQIHAHLEGEAVANGTISVERLLAVLENLQLAVRRIGESIADSKRRPHPGRFRRTVEEQTSLRLVQVTHGSWGAVLELEQPVPQTRMFDIGEEALTVLLESVSDLREGKVLTLSPAEQQIRNLVRVVGSGVDALVLEGGPGRRHVRFDAAVVEQLPPTVAPYLSGRARLSGRLREVDFKDHTAELYDASGRMTRVLFSPVQEALFRSAANMMVTVEGTSEEKGTGAGHIQAELMNILDLREDFWQSPSIRQLAEECNIGPFSRDDIDKADFWPRDQDPEEFVRAIYRERRAGSVRDDDSR